MNRIFPFLVIVLSALIISGPLSRAADGVANDEWSVELVLHAQQDAWNRHDLDSFMAGYWKSADLTFFSGANERHGWQETMDRYKATFRVQGTRWASWSFQTCGSKCWERMRRSFEANGI